MTGTKSAVHTFNTVLRKWIVEEVGDEREMKRRREKICAKLTESSAEA